METSRFTQEQIIGRPRQAEAGAPVKELCLEGGFIDATFYKWRAKYGGMDVPDAKRLRELESEDEAGISALVADGQMRERDERFASQQRHRGKSKSDPLHDKTTRREQPIRLFRPADVLVVSPQLRDLSGRRDRFTAVSAASASTGASRTST